MLHTNETMLRFAYIRAQRLSNDPATQNGAILVPKGYEPITSGVNAIPGNVVISAERLERPQKYTFIEHAERAAIYEAARHGIKTNGATLFCPWFACADCARAIILAGIKHVVGHKQAMDQTPERWQKSIDEGNKMLDEAGVVREYFDGQIFTSDFTILFNGRLWTP
jgi:dCMP deaminase